MALSECGLQPAAGITGYKKLTAPNLPAFPTGCATLFIRKDVVHIPLNLSAACSSNAEFVGAHVRFSKVSFNVVSAYIRPAVYVNVHDCLRYIISSSADPWLICGDLNAHNVSWGGMKTDRRGRDIQEITDLLGLNIANDGSATFFRAPGTYSALDLSIHSQDPPLPWAVEADTWGSDHFPIYIHVLRFGDHKKNATKAPRKVVVWKDFRSRLQDSTEHILEAIPACILAATRTTNVRRTDPP